MAPRRPRPIRWLREHPREADWLLALLLTAISTAIHIAGGETPSPSEERDPTWWSIPLSVLCVLPIAWRRVRPVEVAVGVTAAQVLFTALDFDGGNFIGVVVAIYSLGAHATGPRRSRALVAISSMIGLLFVAGLFVDELYFADLVSSVVVLVTSYVLGDNLRRRREAAAAMAERAERAERERELLARERVAAERARIARELHDVVAHSVSAMLIQATAAKRSLTHSPEQAGEALENIEFLGRRAMDELRSTLGVLRASSSLSSDADDSPDTPSTAPQPTLADVQVLVAEATDLPIEARLDPDLPDSPGSAGLAGYRIVQEALTNVRRHAGEVTRVEVVVERRGDSFHVEVLDDGRGAAADVPGEPGYGIRGMCERVEAVGGTVVSEHRRGGGWRVVAVLPAPAVRSDRLSGHADDRANEPASATAMDVSS